MMPASANCQSKRKGEGTCWNSSNKGKERIKGLIASQCDGCFNSSTPLTLTLLKSLLPPRSDEISSSSSLIFFFFFFFFSSYYYLHIHMFMQDPKTSQKTRYFLILTHDI